MNVQSKARSSILHDRLILHSNYESAAIFMLSNDGMILESNTEGKKLLDYSTDESDERHISRLIPLLKKIDLLEKGDNRVNPYLRFLSRVGYLFKITEAKGRIFDGELYFSDIHYHDQHLIMIIIYRA